MSELPPSDIETAPESIPTPEEIKGLFERFIGAEEFETIKQCEDEKGLYLWDIVVKGEEMNYEYSYMRAGRYPEGQASVTAIHVTFTDSEGMPIGGHSMTKLIEGSWVDTP